MTTITTIIQKIIGSPKPQQSISFYTGPSWLSGRPIGSKEVTKW